MSLITLNQINIVDATVIALDGSLIVARQFTDNLWSSNYEGAVLLPRGGPIARDAEILVATDGYIHYNTNSLEFEGFTNSDWRPIGQLTRDGTAADPSRSFITDPDTGSFLNSIGTYSIVAGGVERFQVTSTAAIAISVIDDTLFNIITPDDKTGTIRWSDTSADRAYIRYNHLTDKFEFSGDGTNVAISINGVSNDITVDSDIVFNGSVSFAGPLTSSDDFIIIIDDDNNENTSVFKIQKHAGVDTGFQITQDGTVQASLGTESLPAFTFVGNTDTGWYFDDFPIDALVATFRGGDNIIIVDEHTTFTTRVRVPDGTALLPSITFADHSTTGIFHKVVPNITFNIAIETAEKLSISDAEMVVFSDLVIQDSVFLGTTGTPTDNIEMLPTATETLTNNTTATVFTFDSTDYDAVIIDYLVKRPSDGSAMGTLYIVTDGTTVTLTDANRTEVNAPGVTFSATIAAGTVSFKYTLTATGNDATMRYGLRRWGI